jgi:hypothetical protein
MTAIRILACFQSAGTHPTPVGTHPTPVGTRSTPVGTRSTPVGTHPTLVGTRSTASHSSFPQSDAAESLSQKAVFPQHFVANFVPNSSKWGFDKFGMKFRQTAVLGQTLECVPANSERGGQ